jgi:hypothetical protein
MSKVVQLFFNYLAEKLHKCYMRIIIMLHEEVKEYWYIVEKYCKTMSHFQKCYMHGEKMLHLGLFCTIGGICCTIIS